MPHFFYRTQEKSITIEPTTPIRELYLRLKDVVEVEIMRIEAQHRLCLFTRVNREKVYEVRVALLRIARAILIKEAIDANPRMLQASKVEGCRDLVSLHKLNFNNINTMLDYRDSYWFSEVPSTVELGQEFDGVREGFRYELSLRETLDISVNNIFNLPQPYFGPLWGKTQARTHVEDTIDGMTSSRIAIG